MAASVRIEDEAFGDGRYEHLGALLGTSKYDAIGRMAVLWRQCTQEQSYVLPESFVRIFVNPDFLVETRLGERLDSGIRIKGTRGRIEWLAKLRKNGRKGGRPRKPNGNHLDNQMQTKSEPKSNPPAPAPAPTNKEEADSPALVVLKDKVDAATGDVGKQRNKTHPNRQLVMDAFHQRYETKYGRPPTWGEVERGTANTLAKKHSFHELVDRMDFMFAGRAKWPPGPYTIGVFASNIDRWVSETTYSAQPAFKELT